MFSTSAGLGHVRRHRQRPAAESLDLRDRSGGLVLAPCHHNNVRTLLGVRQRNGLADPATAARHQRHPAGQSSS